MSWYKVTSQARKGRSFAWIGAAVVVAGLALMWFVYSVFLTIPIDLDGVPLRLTAGTRVSDLAGRLAGRPGNLVAVNDHRVLRPGKGEPAYVLVNGKRAKPDDVLHASDD